MYKKKREKLSEKDARCKVEETAKVEKRTDLLTTTVQFGTGKDGIVV